MSIEDILSRYERMGNDVKSGKDIDPKELESLTMEAAKFAKPKQQAATPKPAPQAPQVIAFTPRKQAAPEVRYVVQERVIKQDNSEVEALRAEVRMLRERPVPQPAPQAKPKYRLNVHRDGADIIRSISVEPI